MNLLASEIDIRYLKMLQEYNDQVRDLERKRIKFYEENPDSPIKYMYMNVIAPPQKINIKIIN